MTQEDFNALDPNSRVMLLFNEGAEHYANFGLLGGLYEDDYYLYRNFVVEVLTDLTEKEARMLTVAALDWPTVRRRLHKTY